MSLNVTKCLLDVKTLNVTKCLLKATKWPWARFGWALISVMILYEKRIQALTFVVQPSSPTPTGTRKENSSLQGLGQLQEWILSPALWNPIGSHGVPFLSPGSGPRKLRNLRSILFVDELHRWSKAQQETALLCSLLSCGGYELTSDEIIRNSSRRASYNLEPTRFVVGCRASYNLVMFVVLK